MKLICDLCGQNLTEVDNDHAICEHCGMEYGPERLQELRAAIPPEPIPPEPEKKTVEVEKKTVEAQPKQQKSGCLTWFLILMAVLDIIIGTHGIVAVFCLLIVWLISRTSKKK